MEWNRWISSGLAMYSDLSARRWKHWSLRGILLGLYIGVYSCYLDVNHYNLDPYIIAVSHLPVGGATFMKLECNVEPTQCINSSRNSDLINVSDISGVSNYLGFTESVCLFVCKKFVN